MSKSESLIPEERIIRRIVLLRNEKIILDVHLAELYQVETRALKQAVRRNLDRFPEDFMFNLTESEIEQVVSQNVIPSKQYLGGAIPFAFTESGVAMLSSVLKSKRAVEMNIAIIRTFVMLRKMASNYQAVMRKLEALDKKYEGRFKEIYKTLNYLINPPTAPMRKIGFKHTKED
jgi:ORF6N domain